MFDTKTMRIGFRQPDLYDESPESSEYSTGSTIMSQTACNKPDQIISEVGASDHEVGQCSQSIQVIEEQGT